MGKGIGGDFTGFHFNGYYSEDLGITRISDGDRYNSDLLPTRNSRTAQNVGGHGTYYWDSFYTQKSFSINFAFDNLTEREKRNLAIIFGTDQISSLWFDEEPYKQYYVLTNNTLQLKTIAFDAEDGSRIYKGEGSIQLTAYYPFATSRFKFIDSSPYVSYTDHPNDLQWYEASGMLITDTIDVNSHYDAAGSNIRLFNPGDIESDCYIYYTLDSATNSAEPNNIRSVQLLKDNSPYAGIAFSSSMSKKGNDTMIRINSRSNVVEGLIGAIDSSDNSFNGELSGNIYNEYIIGGNFFKIPVWNDTVKTLTLVSSGASAGSSAAVGFNCDKIDYMYTYY